MDIDTHDDGAWPDLTGDGRADFDDFVLFAAISDKAKGDGARGSGSGKGGCGCALPGVALIALGSIAMLLMLFLA
jgi:hypothetical protein